MRKRLDRLAQTALTALVTGPPGSGRFRAARYLHHAASGLPRDLRRLSASTRTADGIADLFAAASGKSPRRAGALQTCVLDDIETMPAAAHARLAALLAEGPLAGAPRLIALSSQRPAGLATGAGLRADLWFALAAMPVEMPALDDLPPGSRIALADALLPVIAEPLGLGTVELGAEARNWIARSSWPGNIAEMRAVLTGALVAQPAGVPLSAEHLSAQQMRIATRLHGAEAGGTAFALWLHGALAGGGIVIADIKRALYQAAVDRTHGNLTAAARLLGLTRAQLAYRRGTGSTKGRED